MKIKNKLNSLNPLNEGKWSKIMQGVRKNPQGPFAVVAIENGKVVGQEISITNPQLIPAHYEDMKRKHPNARFSIENGEGLSVYNESIEEGVVKPDELEKNIDNLVSTAKDSLDIDDTQAKDFVSGLVGEGNVVEVNDEVLQNFVKQYGAEKGKQIYYATANKQDRNPETFNVDETGEDWERAGREVEYGINPEAGEDEYEEYRKLKDMLIRGDDETQIDEDNDPVKLKADVAKLMDKLDISSIAPYLQKIDNPVEQAEVIGQFAEKIGVPKAKLSAVVGQLKQVAENKDPKMTKQKLIETVTGKKGKQVIRTVKVKDIK